MGNKTCCNQNRNIVFVCYYFSQKDIWLLLVNGPKKHRVLHLNLIVYYAYEIFLFSISDLIFNENCIFS